MRVGAGGQRAEDHGPDHPGRQALLVRHHACDVALRDVAQLVRQHRGQLLGALRHREQAQVDAQVAAGQGKGVDAALARNHQLPGQALGQLGRHLATLLGGGQQGLPQELQVVDEHGVVEVVRVPVNAAGNAVAKPALGGHGETFAVAEAGEREVAAWVAWGVRARALCGGAGGSIVLRLNEACGPGQSERQQRERQSRGPPGARRDRKHGRMMPPTPYRFTARTRKAAMKRRYQASRTCPSPLLLRHRPAALSLISMPRARPTWWTLARKQALTVLPLPKDESPCSRRPWR